MPRLRDAEYALRLATNASRQPFICRNCRAQAIRQFHTSNPRPFLKAIRESLFGSEESREAERKREEKAQKQAKRDADRGDLETFKTDHKQYSIAAIIDPSINPEYVMSTNWDGLRRIGSKHWQRVTEDTGEKYVGFAPEKRLTLGEHQWTMLLHHIAVEILALKQANRDLDGIYLPRRSGTKGWLETKNTTIVSESSTREASLRFASPESQDLILSAITRTATKDAESAPPSKRARANAKAKERENAERRKQARQLAEDLREIVAQSKPSQYEHPSAWMDLKLKDPTVKFAVIKRVVQMTGHRIPDPTISTAHTLSDLHNALKTKERPKGLANQDKMKRLDVDAPNVVVYSKKRTPIQKEKEIGRWKIIEEELIARDLPVTGYRKPGSRTSARKD